MDSNTSVEEHIQIKGGHGRVKGGRGQVVKAVDCDSTIRGFDSRRSPF